jgi:threonine/homoserine/homoserine lactone efflux protein
VRALVEGILAGLGIAVPVGPIAVLLVDLSTRRGFVPAFPAAMGAASADLTYATVAAIVGVAIADTVEALAEPLRIVSVLALLSIVAIRTRDLIRGRGAVEAESSAERVDRSPIRTYATFLGLTLLNPVTITYFAALILGLQDDVLSTATSKALFVVGAFVASASWQVLLIGAGAVLHHRLPASTQLVAGLVGNLVILAFAVRLAFE